MKFAAASIATLALALAACSSSRQPRDEEPAAARPAAPQKTVFDTQFKALQKAKDVQKVVNKQKADLDKALKDQGG